MRKSVTTRQMTLEAATVLANGAITIDEYDRVVFDRLLRRFPLWDRIDSRLAPGDTTGGFEQTAMATARSELPRSLGFTATSPTRAGRTRRALKAIVSDITFGMFDRSVYQQQGRRHGDLERRDVQDMASGCLKRWAGLAWQGSESSDPKEFDGVLTILGSGTDVQTNQSIVEAITQKIVELINQEDHDVLPTGIYCNAQVQQFINLEFLSIGDKLRYAEVRGGQFAFEVPILSTAAGNLPIFPDPFLRAVAGTPVTYPLVIATEELVSWQYVEPEGIPGREPRTFQLNRADDLDDKFKTVMFGAIELLGGTNHHARLNVKHRDVVVPPAKPAAA